MKQICYYSIIRFIPDLLRNEPKNIGLMFYGEANVYDCKLLTTQNPKISSYLKDSDKDIISNYYNFFKEINPSSKNEFIEFSKIREGQLQCTEVKTVVTDNIEKEIDYLYSLYIQDRTVNSINRRFRTKIKAQLNNLKLIGQDKLQPNKTFNPLRSDIKYTVDFSYQNGRTYLIDAVDLTLQDKRDTYKTAFKFDDLSKGRKKSIETISVVTLPQNQNVKEYVDVLNRTSTVFDFSNGGQQDFLKLMTKIVK